MALEVGLQPIPGYRLTRPLGKGAFGEVWEARHEQTDERLALKFLDCRARSASVIASEVRVLRALAGLEHPHIIPLKGVHACGKYFILIMERADCTLGDLHDAYIQQTGGNVPVDHALELLEQAADALDFLASARLVGVSTSARGLQHCDIKPSNLLLVGNQLKVGDFGLCASASWVTHSKGWKGTRPYAAPELFKGSAAPGTDQYALAVTFCELVMGAGVFWPDSQINSAPNGMPIDMTKLREKEFQVISRALHPYPSSRYPSCKAFLEALRQVVQMPRSGSTTSSRIYPRGLRGPLNRSSSGRHRAVKASSESTGKAPSTITLRPSAAQLLHPAK